jgi:hypothetical protein
MHDMSILLLPLILGISESLETADWMRAGLIAVPLAGFSIFWLAQDSFYFGVLFTLLFFGVEIFRLWKAPVPTATLSQSAAYAEK